MLCPRCSEQGCAPVNRQPAERWEEKDGKKWLIEYCPSCKFNFELTEWPKSATAKRKDSWFKSKLRPDPDEDR